MSSTAALLASFASILIGAVIGGATFVVSETAERF